MGFDRGEDVEICVLVLDGLGVDMLIQVIVKKTVGVLEVHKVTSFEIGRNM